MQNLLSSWSTTEVDHWINIKINISNRLEIRKLYIIIFLIALPFQKNKKDLNNTEKKTSSVWFELFLFFSKGKTIEKIVCIFVIFN